MQRKESSSRSPLAYTDVGKGREQDAEALRAILLIGDFIACFAIVSRPQAGSYNKNGSVSPANSFCIESHSLA